jgi:hypothetical protein
MSSQLKKYKEGNVRSAVGLQLNLAFINRPQKTNAIKTKQTYQLQDTADIVPLVKTKK